MTPPRLTEAQARALGIPIPAGTTRPPARKRTTRTAAARGGAVSECVECGARFTADAAETRHANGTRHARYQFVLDQ